MHEGGDAIEELGRTGGRRQRLERYELRRLLVKRQGLNEIDLPNSSLTSRSLLLEPSSRRAISVHWARFRIIFDRAALSSFAWNLRHVHSLSSLNSDPFIRLDFDVVSYCQSFAACSFDANAFGLVCCHWQELERIRGWYLDCSDGIMPAATTTLLRLHYVGLRLRILAATAVRLGSSLRSFNASTTLRRFALRIRALMKC